jgi:hypothetical protein
MERAALHTYAEMGEGIAWEILRATDSDVVGRVDAVRNQERDFRSNLMG